MHTPPPVSDACGQWISAIRGLVAATERWYVRQASVFPGAVDPGVPRGRSDVLPTQSAYGSLLPAQVAEYEEQKVDGGGDGADARKEGTTVTRLVVRW